MVVAAALFGALVLVPQGARAATKRPLPIHSASLTQDGQQLVWDVHLTRRFSPAALRPDRRSLCLAIERPANGSVAGVLCAEPARAGKRARLVFRPVTARGRGAGTVIDATLSRSGPTDLTARFLPSAVGRSYSAFRWQVLSAVDSPPCTAVCSIWFPAKPVLARLHTPQVVGCVPSGAPLVYHGPSNQREIALTFDDGPWSDTAQFLDVLEREHAHATFFQLGLQIGGFDRSVERRILADGNMIGDHTWSHANVTGGGAFAASQISSTAAAIRAATGGFQPCLFRSPGGALSSALVSEARSMGFTTIQWDIDPRDWATPGTGAIYANVVGNAHNGAIAVMHDGGGNRSQTLAALPQIIHTLRARGYQFVTITELLGQQLVYK